MLYEVITLFSQVAAVFFNEVRDQGRDIINPFTQWGQVNVDDIEPVVDVITSYSIHYTKLYES